MYLRCIGQYLGCFSQQIRSLMKCFRYLLSRGVVEILLRYRVLQLSRSFIQSPGELLRRVIERLLEGVGGVGDRLGEEHQRLETGRGLGVVHRDGDVEEGVAPLDLDILHRVTPELSAQPLGQLVTELGRPVPAPDM